MAPFGEGFKFFEGACNSALDTFWSGFPMFESGAKLCAGHCSVGVFPHLEAVSNWVLDGVWCVFVCDSFLNSHQLLSDVFGASPWHSVLSSVEDSYLQLLVPDVVNLQFVAKAPTTLPQYSLPWLR